MHDKSSHRSTHDSSTRIGMHALNVIENEIEQGKAQHVCELTRNSMVCSVKEEDALVDDVIGGKSMAFISGRRQLVTGTTRLR
jgi:hypothetical protein